MDGDKSKTARASICSTVLSSKDKSNVDLSVFLRSRIMGRVQLTMTWSDILVNASLEYVD